MIAIDEAVFYQYTIEASAPVASSGSPWPAGQLVVAPGDYTFDNGVVYNCQAEGFYCFWADNGATFDGGNLIVENGDVMLFMASMARACGYGMADEGQTIAQQIQTARSRALWLRCGPTIAFVEYWLGLIGVAWREVHALTANTPATPGINLTLDPNSGDGVDMGHTLIEVMVGGKWVLADVATDAAYKNASGAWLSMGAVVSAGGPSSCVTVDLADHDIEQDNYSGSFMSGVFANIKMRPENIARWRRAIYQIPGILDGDGNIYYGTPPGTEGRASWVLSLASNYRVMAWSDWLTKYYPGGA